MLAPALVKVDPVSRWVLWTLELSLTVLGVVWLVRLSDDDTGVYLLVTWNALAVAYIGLGSFLLSRDLPGAGAEPIGELVGPRWYTQMLALVASGTGLAGGFALIATRDSDDAVFQTAAATTVLLSWLLLHTAFAQMYARMFLADGGLEFPDCPRPQLAEFVYFSFTIGTTFAVSDVTVVDRSMRRRVTAHSILSFFFNTAVIAIAVDWLKG